MRQLLPHPVDAADLDPATIYRVDRSPVDGRPWVMANMVTTVDGATAVDGRSAGVSNDADRALFHHLRTLADVVLVGAGTARTERYRPIVGADPRPLAVVSRSLALDWGSPLFVAAAARTLVLTSRRADPAALAQARAVADVCIRGDDQVDLEEALRWLGQRGHQVVLTEGGPSLLGDLRALGLLDELFLTLTPQLVGATDSAPLTGHGIGRVETPVGLTLVTVLEDHGTLFLRYLVDRATGS